jgi:hypothetical protein
METQGAKQYAFTKRYAYWRQRPLVSIRTGSVRFQPAGLPRQVSENTVRNGINGMGALEETGPHYQCVWRLENALA